MDQQNYNVEEDWGSDQALAENDGSVKKPTHILSIIAFACSLGSWIINPLSLMPFAAIVLGIIALVKSEGRPKWMAIVAIVHAVIAIPIFTAFEIVMAVFTMGGSLLF